MYILYMLRCADNSLYTGITNDLEKRLAQHQRGLGSKYVRSRLPFELVYSEKLEDKSAALKKELAIKALRRLDKELLCKEWLLYRPGQRA